LESARAGSKRIVRSIIIGGGHSINGDGAGFLH
jgi:hypothetical protein